MDKDLETHINNMSLRKLKQTCRHCKIKGYSNKTKAEIRQLLLNNREKLIGSGLFDWISKPFTAVVDKVAEFVDYRKGYTNHTKNTLNKYGSLMIMDMTLQRCPIQAFVRKFMNTISLGVFEKLLDKYGFDKLFHLSLLLTLQDGTKVVVEKNEEINVSTTIPPFVQDCEQLKVNYLPQVGFTLNKLMDTTRAKIPEKRFYDYDAHNYNCQVFLMDVLKSNGLMYNKLKDFIYQDVDALFEEASVLAPHLEPTGKFATRAATIWNKIIGKGNYPKSVILKGSAFTNDDAWSSFKDAFHCTNVFQKELGSQVSNLGAVTGNEGLKKVGQLHQDMADTVNAITGSRDTEAGKECQSAIEDYKRDPIGTAKTAWKQLTGEDVREKQRLAEEASKRGQETHDRMMQEAIQQYKKMGRNPFTGKGLFDRKWGTFTSQMKLFNKAQNKNMDLTQFANYVLQHPDKFIKRTQDRARFYLNIISKKKGGVRYTDQVAQAKQFASDLGADLVGSYQLTDILNQYGDRFDEKQDEIGSPDDYDLVVNNTGLNERQVRFLTDLGYTKKGRPPTVGDVGVFKLEGQPSLDIIPKKFSDKKDYTDPDTLKKLVLNDYAGRDISSEYSAEKNRAILLKKAIANDLIAEEPQQREELGFDLALPPFALGPSASSAAIPFQLGKRSRAPPSISRSLSFGDSSDEDAGADAPAEGDKSGTGAITPQLLTKKKIPDDFSNEINLVLKLISFNREKLEILGSQSIKSQVWASDYDCFEVVNKSSIQQITSGLQKIIKRILSIKNFYIGDIKIGNDNRFRVINEYSYFNHSTGKVNGYNFKDAITRLNTLKSKNIISLNEYKEVKALLKENPTPLEWTKIMKYARFNVLRWKPADILKGSLHYRKQNITLQQAMKSDGLVKMDLVVLLSNGIYQEISVIYDLRVNNKRINVVPINTIQTLKNDIILFSAEGKWFKALKRLFSLYNYYISYGNETQKRMASKNIQSVSDILTSDIGILYQVKGDMDSIAFLLENHKPNKKQINAEIDNYINRLNNVYSVPAFSRTFAGISREMKNIQSYSPAKKAKSLEHLISLFETIINDETKKRIGEELQKHLSGGGDPEPISMPIIPMEIPEPTIIPAPVPEPTIIPGPTILPMEIPEPTFTPVPLPKPTIMDLPDSAPMTANDDFEVSQPLQPSTPIEVLPPAYAEPSEVLPPAYAEPSVTYLDPAPMTYDENYKFLEKLKKKIKEIGKIGTKLLDDENVIALSVDPQKRQLWGRFEDLLRLFINATPKLRVKDISVFTNDINAFITGYGEKLIVQAVVSPIGIKLVNKLRRELKMFEIFKDKNKKLFKKLNDELVFSLRTGLELNDTQIKNLQDIEFSGETLLKSIKHIFNILKRDGISSLQKCAYFDVKKADNQYGITGATYSQLKANPNYIIDGLNQGRAYVLSFTHTDLNTELGHDVGLFKRGDNFIYYNTGYRNFDTHFLDSVKKLGFSPIIQEGDDQGASVSCRGNVYFRLIFRNAADKTTFTKLYDYVLKNTFDYFKSEGMFLDLAQIKTVGSYVIQELLKRIV